ncbi:transporter substrate-binding domain-containing diguanylate cyclase [Amphritea japonica]|uniref:diguanylate cyclase n=1 Tax=Amphritea japonica ATCC BAA-1530 TaxID=1278309 RepID=A0A7R6PNN2_9GAMM|nr:diguanylate cyclase [Amphritea japonica]BBB27620.1 signal transduction protein [Amphritea japonica ATCC BAA-1530]
MLSRRIKLFLFILSITLATISQSAEKPTSVSLQLIWKHQFQFAGYYMAKHKGFYREAGIELSIHEFNSNEDPVELVLNGSRDFAVGRSTILSQRIKGAGIVALLATYQNSPLMLLTTAESGISQPSDLLNKRIMMTPDAEKQVELLAMLRQSGVHSGSFTRQEHSFDIDALIEGKTDAMASYISNEPFQMDQLGEQYNILHPKEFGFSMYSDLLFTSESLLENEPALVEAFRQATIEGWLYAFENIEETADLIISEYNSQNRSKSALIFEGNQLAKLAFDNDGNFGSLDHEKLKVMSQLYLLFNFISPGYNIEDFIYQPKVKSQLSLTIKEHLFLATQPTLRLCGDPSRAPYSHLTNGKYEGVGPDYLELIGQRTGLKFKTITHSTWNKAVDAIKKGDCDIISGAMQTPDRAHYMDFSDIYLSLPAVLAVNSTTAEDVSLADLIQAPIAIVAGSSFIEILTSRYPSISIIEVSSVTEGLTLLKDSQVVALLDAPNSISSAISKANLSGIKVIDQVRDNWDISVAISHRFHDTPLLSIINKAIVSFSPEERNAINDRWIKITFVHKTDYTLIWQIFLGISLIFLFLAYRYRVIHLHNRQLKEMARQDQLTGLNNRRVLIEALNEHSTIAARYNRPVSVIFFDLDDFKLINDHFGHFEGDIVLKAIANLLQSHCRLADVYGRWGGEEFLIILPESNLSQATQSAEKIRLALQKYDFDSSIAKTVTGSFGVAQLSPNESINSIIQRVDQALYRAKSAGKNCVRKDVYRKNLAVKEATVDS